jgi:hypothetical protein
VTARPAICQESGGAVRLQMHTNAARKGPRRSTGVKRYATGMGGAPEDRVLAAAAGRDQTVQFTGDGEAGALVLAAMGAGHLGCPLVTMPPAHQAAVATVAWPEVAR